MLKALLKKQFLELNTFYFQNKKTGKMRSRAGIVGYIILYAAIFLMLGVIFFGVGTMMAGVLVPMGLDWLYFALMGLMAIFLGVFGDVFNTYAGVYHAKDNELLLSMPIPPVRILFVRMIGVYAMGLLYEGLVFIPAAVAYWVNAKVTALNVICPLLMFFVIGFFVMTLSCALGWVVALIASKLKNKSIITVLMSVIFLALYYVVYFRINTYLQDLMLHAESLGNTIKGSVYPVYAMGVACTGNVVALLIVALVVAALLALTCYVLQRSFVYITTMKNTGKKAVYKEQTVKVVSAKKALIRKESRRFLSSPTYMLNCGLGLLLMVVLAGFALIRMGWLRGIIAMLGEEMPGVVPFLPLIVLLAIGCAACMNAITAPSVSLEGKTIWLSQSLPVEAWEVLDAKRTFGMYLNLVPAVLCTLALGFVLELPFTTMMYMLVFTIVLVALQASVGLALNLKHPNLTWTSETVPVKQGASVMITMFGGWAAVMLLGAGGYLLRSVISVDNYILIAAIVMALCARFVDRWLRTKGTALFASL